jgi:hypothetical protein
MLQSQNPTAPSAIFDTNATAVDMNVPYFFLKMRKKLFDFNFTQYNNKLNQVRSTIASVNMTVS